MLEQPLRQQFEMVVPKEQDVLILLLLEQPLRRLKVVCLQVTKLVLILLLLEQPLRLLVRGQFSDKGKS